MRWELLDRYLSGQCEPAERLEVERWAAESPLRQQVLERMVSALDDTPPEALETMRLRLEKELGLEAEPGEKRKRKTTRPSKPRDKRKKKGR